MLRDYDVVLNSLDKVTLEKSLRVLKPGGQLISISGPPDAAFARTNRIRQPVVTNPTVDVVGPLAELELWCVEADHDQVRCGVVTMPRLHIGRGANPVDAGVFPDVEQDDLSAIERRR